MMMVNEFKTEVLKTADEVGVKPKEIHVRKMTRKWASCSSKGRLTFSFELLERKFEDRMKVVVHELLHLRYPHHGKIFHSMLKHHLKKKGINNYEL